MSLPDDSGFTLGFWIATGYLDGPGKIHPCRNLGTLENPHGKPSWLEGSCLVPPATPHGPTSLVGLGLSLSIPGL
ncbi:hypothetical protein ABT063_31415 [Streptomyces sp. NPDC002838]|uniref:hypothetical protein n=1 Tax=Streptomyces sp. NPDC002838 TaxID=3154436 RepID=UPI00331E20C9